MPFTAPELDRALYQRLIEAYYGFYSVLESRLDQFGLLDPTEQYDRHKVPALVSDLRALGLTSAQITNLPRCEDIPEVKCRAQLLGVLYVIEGATLGGQVLRRIVQDKLSIDASSGGLFLDVYGPATGPMWKAFLGMLASVVEPEQCVLATEAALAAFRCFERWLERSEVLP